MSSIPEHLAEIRHFFPGSGDLEPGKNSIVGDWQARSVAEAAIIDAWGALSPLTWAPDFPGDSGHSSVDWFSSPSGISTVTWAASTVMVLVAISRSARWSASPGFFPSGC
ncbi:MAG: hypothetical protein R2735_05675 [Microthrixaceae bacterium]